MPSCTIDFHLGLCFQCSHESRLPNFCEGLFARQKPQSPAHSPPIRPPVLRPHAWTALARQRPSAVPFQGLCRPAQGRGSLAVAPGGYAVPVPCSRTRTGAGSLLIKSTSCSFVRAGGRISPVRKLCSRVSRLIAPFCHALTKAAISDALII